MRIVPGPDLYLPQPVRWLIDAIARPLGLDPAEEIHISRVDIAQVTQSSRDALVLTYQFEHVQPMKGRVIALDLSNCPLRVAGVVGRGCRVPAPEGIRVCGRRVVLCELLPGEDWHTASLEIRLDWPRGPGTDPLPRVIMFPAMMPGLLNESFHLRRWPQAVLGFRGNCPPAAFVRTGGPQDDAFRQLALTRERLAGAVAVDRHVDVDLGGGLVDLDDAHQVSITSLLGRIAAFLATDLHCDMQMRLLALGVDGPSTEPANWGPCLLEEPGAYGELSGGQPNHPTLARDIAGLWWGAGVRLVGEGADTLSFAICGALALRWTEQVDAARAATCLDGYAKLSRDERQAPVTREGTRLLVAVAEGLRSHAAMDGLRALTAEHLGFYAPAQTVRDVLIHAGVAL